MKKTNTSIVDYPNRISMTIPELAQYLGVGRQAAERIACDAGAKFKVGKRALVYVNKVEKYIEETLIQ